MKSDNNSFRSEEEFKYLGTTLTNQNSIQERIKSGMMSGNAFDNLSPSLLPKNM